VTDDSHRAEEGKAVLPTVDVVVVVVVVVVVGVVGARTTANLDRNGTWKT
jgi:hypothetical protein